MQEYQRRPEPSEIPEYYRNYVQQTNGDKPLALLQKGGEKVANFLKSLSPDKWDYRYAAGKWTIKEMVLHLIDTERVFAYRILRISRGDTTPLPGFDQDVFVLGSEAGVRSAESLIEEYKAVRAATLALAASLSSLAWERKGTASGVTFSPLTLAYITAGHEIHHLSIIKERYL